MKIRQLGLSRLPIPLKLHEDMNTPVKLSGRPQGCLLMPKRKPLPSAFALGRCPPKPQRPPHVKCDVFRRNAEKSIQGKLEISVFNDSDSY